MNKPVSLQTVLESAEALSTEDQDVLIERIQSRRIEQQQASLKHSTDAPPVFVSEQAMETRTRQRLEAFQEWVETHRPLTLPTLSEEAMSRESIYGERG